MVREKDSGDEMLLLVDEYDNVKGKETKERCHDGAGLLHRAFMAVVVDSGKILLARRSSEKRLWPGFWDGTVSSHVHEGESYEESAHRRVEEELLVRCRDIRYLFKFRYQVPYGDQGSEHEVCAVLLARAEGAFKPDLEEISETQWLSWDEFLSDLKKNPGRYCPWLALASERMEKEFRKVIVGVY